MTVPSGGGVDVSPDHQADVTLRAALAVMRPLVRWLLRRGVNYPRFAVALKGIFAAEARAELARSGGRITDSAVSVLSGVHRKDLRAFSERERSGLAPAQRPPSLVSQLVTRWLTDPRYQEPVEPAPGSAPVRAALALARSGPAPSFESLAREISTDVHPRTLLDELLRLGVVVPQGEQVVLESQAFVPSRVYAEMADLLAASVSDHLAAAVHNLSGGQPRFLEQSVFAGGLTDAAAEELATLARALWAPTLQTMVAEAAARARRTDGPLQGGMRIRLGTYFFHERVDGPDDRGLDAGQAAATPGGHEGDG